MNFDVVIIGGGPAGTLCGIELQKNGMRTCIIDKSKFPREKLCGGLLTQKSIDLLKKICPQINSEKFIINQLSDIDFYNKNKKIETFKTKSTYYFTERNIFDNLLVEEYKKCGGTMFENCFVHKNHIDTNNNFVIIGNEKLHYKILVDAAGCNSVMCKSLAIKRFDYFCKETKLNINCENERSFRIYFGYSANGYGWYFPKKKHITVGSDFDSKSKTSETNLNLFFETTRCENALSMKGAFVPSGRKMALAKVKSNTLLIGDAAGFIDPISGEGIYNAMLSGVLAAKAIAENINSIENLQKYFSKETHEIRKNIKWGRIMHAVIFRLLPMKFVMKSAKKHHSFIKFYFEKVVSTNEYSYKNFIPTYLRKYRNAKD